MCEEEADDSASGRGVEDLEYIFERPKAGRKYERCTDPVRINEPLPSRFRFLNELLSVINDPNGGYGVAVALQLVELPVWVQLPLATQDQNKIPVGGRKDCYSSAKPYNKIQWIYPNNTTTSLSVSLRSTTLERIVTEIIGRSFTAN